jgi:hypothetical protein
MDGRYGCDVPESHRPQSLPGLLIREQKELSFVHHTKSSLGGHLAVATGAGSGTITDTVAAAAVTSEDDGSRPAK